MAVQTVSVGCEGDGWWWVIVLFST
jgi:hypothetical protein